MAIPKAVAFLVFPVLIALAFNYEFEHLESSGAMASLGAKCTNTPTSETPYLLHYTGHPRLDPVVCRVITLFMEMLNSEKGYKVLDYILGTTGILVLLPYAEVLRGGSGGLSPFVAYPGLWLFLSQGISIGITFPLYWLVYITAGPLDARRAQHPTSSFASTPPNLAQALSLAFSIIIGASIPSTAMTGFKDPYITFIWQFYPIIMSTAYYLHYWSLPKAWRQKDGLWVVRCLFWLILVLSSSAHLAAVWPSVLGRDYDGVWALVVPEVGLVNGHGRDLVDQIADFLKWDMSFAFLATSLATLWLARSVNEVVGFVVWYLVVGPVFGVGAAITAVVIWVENLL